MNAYLEEIAKLRDQVSWLEAEVARLSSVDDLVCERRQSKRSVQDILLERMKHEQMGNS